MNDMNETTRPLVKRLWFTPEITLGNMVQLVSIVAMVIGLWVNMDKRIAALELRQIYIVEERSDLKRSVQMLTENQAMLSRTVDRMAILFEQHPALRQELIDPKKS